MNLAPAAEPLAPGAPSPECGFSSLRNLRHLPDALMRTHLRRRENGAHRLIRLRRCLDEARLAPARRSAVKDRVRAAAAELQLHELYFENLSSRPSRVSRSFAYTLSIGWGSFEAWKDEFRSLAGADGVGWVILLMDPVDYQLSHHCVGLHGENIPAGFVAVLVMDMKAHAFAGMDRSTYIEAFLENIDWTCVEDRHAVSRTRPAS